MGKGAYRQNFVDDIESIELLLAHGLPEGLPYAVSCISVYIAIFMIDWRMGLLSLVTLPIGMVVMCGMAISGTEKGKQYRVSLVNLNKAKEILELGCGTGQITFFMAEQVKMWIAQTQNRIRYKNAPTHTVGAKILATEVN